MQLRFPLWNARPNGVSLADAQLNFAMVGAKDPQSIGSVRFPGSGDERDPDWRPLDLDVDDPASPPPDFDGLVEPDDPTTLYYWRP